MLTQWKVYNNNYDDKSNPDSISLKPTNQCCHSTKIAKTRKFRINNLVFNYNQCFGLHSISYRVCTHQTLHHASPYSGIRCGPA